MSVKQSALSGSIFFLIATLLGCATMNNYQISGDLHLGGLKEPVKVIRDEKGMAYIHAGSLDDVIKAQGFVMAQDRLFQMEMIRMAAQGRISEMTGEKAKKFDIRMRTLGFHRHAKKHTAILDEDTHRYFENFTDGVNAYIKSGSKTWPLEFKLAGLQPKQWAVADVMSIIYYMSWGTSANLETEIVAQELLEKVGPDRIRDILPLNINPDDPPESLADNDGFFVPRRDCKVAFRHQKDRMTNSFYPLAVGSNNWVAAGRLTAHGLPILANDPHMEANLLPGIWYPCGLITPTFRAVGTTISGLPGLLVFRNGDVAIGITNAYGDTQDLYIETLDPNEPSRYMEGERSLPFEVIRESVTIKDKKAPTGFRNETIAIRYTRRGPVVSNLLPGLQTDKTVTLRWAPYETKQSHLGLKKLLISKSVSDIRQALKYTNLLMLNFVFTDTKGNIGWQASGKLPIRSQKDGTFPFEVKGELDNWTGWIPHEKMPHEVNPKKGWLGTCNHTTVGQDYSYYYSSYQAPSYRYQRLKALMNTLGKKTADDFWSFQRDTLNLMAKTIAPIMVNALVKHEKTRAMGTILSKWDYHDDQDLAAPTIFQAVYRHFAQQVFIDELGEELTAAMLGNWYFWRERLQQMVLDNDASWFDDKRTVTKTESRDDIFRRAALTAFQELSLQMGRNSKKWRWGRVHRITYLNPIRQKGIGKGWLGGGTHPVSGSAETLRRNIYDFNQPFDVIISDSLRMVADLNDSEKVMAIFPGGISGRTFHPHAKDQIKRFIKGEKAYWWFSDTAIREHAASVLTLLP